MQLLATENIDVLIKFIKFVSPTYKNSNCNEPVQYNSFGSDILFKITAFLNHSHYRYHAFKYFESFKVHLTAEGNIIVQMF